MNCDSNISLDLRSNRNPDSDVTQQFRARIGVDGICNVHPDAGLTAKQSLDTNTRSLSTLEYSASNQPMAVAQEEVTILVAADAGAVANVIPPDDLPAGCVPSG